MTPADSLARQPKATWWTTIIPYGNAQSVPGVLTTLLAFTDYGSAFDALAIFLSNEDPTTSCDLVIDVSHGGTKKVGELTQTHTVAAGEEGYVAVGPHNPFTFLRVAASSTSTIAVKWALLGLRR